MRKVFALLVIILILVSATAFVVHYSLFDENRETKPFYVGVTYCGNSTEEAKMLLIE
jgi:Trk-type K+ transport system membrane component